MIIAGLDLSKRHYALCITDQKAVDYTFSTNYKDIAQNCEKLGYQCHYIWTWPQFKKKVSNNPFCYTAYCAYKIKACLASDDFYIGEDSDKYLAIEGYSFGSATGQLTQIAEVTGIVKNFLLNCGWKIRIHDPRSVKMFATGNGNAVKEEMLDRAKKAGLKIPYFIEEREQEVYDIADAFFLMKMLQMEIVVRNDPTKAKRYPENQRRILNRVTQANPVNILDRDFLEIMTISEKEEK